MQIDTAPKDQFLAIYRELRTGLAPEDARRLSYYCVAAIAEGADLWGVIARTFPRKDSAWLHGLVQRGLQQCQPPKACAA